MTSDRIAAGSGIAHAHLYFLNVDPDLGVAVLTAGAEEQAVAARRRRAGRRGGYPFFIDPKDDLFVLCMVQTHLHR